MYPTERGRFAVANHHGVGNLLKPDDAKTDHSNMFAVQRGIVVVRVQYANIFMHKYITHKYSFTIYIGMCLLNKEH